MTDQVAETPENESPEDEAATTEAAPESEDTQATDAEATWRKRLNGQTSATNKAIAERDELRQRVAAFEAREREAQMAGLSEVERLKAEKADAERRAQEAEQRANDKFLDKFYPKARADFPEIRDEAKLARLEATFSDDAPAAEPDPARSLRAPKNASANVPREKSIEELEADLAKMPNPWAGFGGTLSR